MKPDINYALFKKKYESVICGIEYQIRKKQAAKMEAAAQKPVGSAYTEDQV